MTIFTSILEKPWQSGELDVPCPGGVDRARSKRLALRFFLAVLTVLFSLFIVTFLARSQYPDFKPLAGDVWQPFFDASKLWKNTSVLIAAGICVHFVADLANHKKQKLALIVSLMAGLLMIQFVLMQLSLWQYLNELGFSITSNPANSYFYVLSGVHGMHILGGVTVLGAAALRLARNENFSESYVSFALCRTYFHYLLGVWLVLFALTVSSSQTYRTLAALCGY